jgi:hypothetical protein
MNSFVLKDVQLQYASLARPNTEGEYASGKFEVRVIMNKEQVQTLKGFGLSRLVSFRKEEDGSYSTNLRTNKKPRVVFRENRQDLTTEQLESLGNGTTANVKGVVYSTPKGSFLGLEAIAVIDYKEYSKELSDDLFDGEDSIPPFSTEDDDLLDD